MKYLNFILPKKLCRRSALVVASLVVLTLQFHADICLGFATRTMTKTRPINPNAEIWYNFDSTALMGRALRDWKKSTTSRKDVLTFISPTTALMGMWSQNDEIEGSDRIKACIPYLLPLIDGDHFGKYIYERVPIMGAIDQVTIGPLDDLGHSIPFLSLGLFIALTLGTRFNTTMSRNLRFSAQQAALIDVSLLFPELIGSGFVEDPLPRYIAEPCCNFVWYAYMSIVVYCLVSNLRGKKPDQIPYLSDAADMMVGPF